MKTEFSPMSKLQYLLQMALLFVLIHNKSSPNKEQGKNDCDDCCKIIVLYTANIWDCLLTDKVEITPGDSVILSRDAN